jgi:nucleoside 2-deoxyribosyltransferase
MNMKNNTREIKVYCAGPLFNQSERDEMTQIAEALQESGFMVYLPHRDGMEFRLIMEIFVKRGWSQPIAAAFLHSAIFALDIYQLVDECDAAVWNLNGRTPDEGAVSEAAIAWMLGKPLVAYTDDVRSLIAGRINPLLVGLVEFETTDCIKKIPQILSQKILNSEIPEITHSRLPGKVQKAVEDGKKLWEAIQTENDELDNEMIADVVEELFAPDQPSSIPIC